MCWYIPLTGSPLNDNPTRNISVSKEARICERRRQDYKGSHSGFLGIERPGRELMKDKEYTCET